jgi:hypothetical protein
VRKEERSFFLKKRTKKLLSVLGGAGGHVWAWRLLAMSSVRWP